MSPEDYRRLNQLFFAALELREEERAAFLDQNCGGDAGLRRRIEVMLSADAETTHLIDLPIHSAAAELFSDEASELLSGRRLGHYLLSREIGRGGMGAVYLAYDDKLERRVALKVLPARFTTDAERVRRFQREARAATALNHPNILTIFDIGQEEGRHYIATEFVEGQTLRSLIGGAEMSPGKAIDVAIQIASALAAAHQAGIVHRDIKPENVMVRPDGYVKVLDFGLAKLTEPDWSREGETAATRSSVFETQSGVILGTVAYMSPEQLRGQKVDARSDLFSLGVVLYEMLMGERPFTGETRNHLVVAILDQSPPPLAPGLPEGLQPIVSRLLAKERTARYGKAQELLSALRQFKDELVAAGVKSSGKTLVVAEAASGHTSVSAQKWLRAFRRRKPVALTAVALLAASSWLGWQWFGPRPAQRFAAHERLQLTKLTNSGRISSGRLSPDGQFAAYLYANRELWISQLTEGNANRLLPGADAHFFGMTFSRDSAFLYYCSRPAGGTNYTLYQIPTLGGAPRKLLDGVKTLAVSPTNGRLVLLRSVTGQRQFSVSLVQPDGSGEQPFFTTDCELNHFAWSPDGSRIAYSRNGEDEQGRYWEVVERRLADSREQILTPRYRYEIDGLAWLSGDDGLLFCAEDEAKGVRQIWRLDYGVGARRNVTNDLNNYYGLSLSADSGKLLTVIQDRPTRIYTAPLAEPERLTPLPLGVANYRETAWLPDGRLIYSLGVNGQYDVTGQRDLWVTAFDGGQPQRLTSDRRGNWMPAVSADGRSVVYVSRRSGDYNIWRCDQDGGHDTQLTFNGGTHPRLTPDGQWVFFGNQNAIWKIPLAGGSPVGVVAFSSSHPDVSPDGKMLAYAYIDRELNRFRVAVRNLADATARQTFNIRLAYEHLRWAPDGRGLLFINDENNGVYLQPLTGPLRKLFAPPPGETVYAFSISPDGQRIAYTIGTRTSDLVLLSESTSTRR